MSHKPSAVLKEVREPKYRMRVVPAKKGKGSFKRIKSCNKPYPENFYLEF